MELEGCTPQTTLCPRCQIEGYTAERAERSDTEILGELRELAALPDEGDAAWELDETWARAFLLTALADVAAARRLEGAIGLILDKMALGDPGELMRGMRHRFEAIVAPDGSRLSEICASRATSERAGTRYWALDQLGILREPAVLSAILSRFDDSIHTVSEAAFMAAALTVQDHPKLRNRVVEALRAISRKRQALRTVAESYLRELES